MILTVADLQKAIAGLPPTLPVRIECYREADLPSCGVCNGCDQVETCGQDHAGDETCFAEEVQFQAGHVLITAAD